MNEALTTQIRQVLSERANLPTDAFAISDDADLYATGLTSFASVEVMLGLEDAFGVSFPDTMLKRSLFESIDAMATAIAELQHRAQA
jgi:acyl carrier protein